MKVCNISTCLSVAFVAIFLIAGDALGQRGGRGGGGRVGGGARPSINRSPSMSRPSRPAAGSSRRCRAVRPRVRISHRLANVPPIPGPRCPVVHQRQRAQRRALPPAHDQRDRAHDQQSPARDQQSPAHDQQSPARDQQSPAQGLVRVLIPARFRAGFGRVPGRVPRCPTGSNRVQRPSLPLALLPQSQVNFQPDQEAVKETASLGRPVPSLRG